MSSTLGLVANCVRCGLEQTVGELTGKGECALPTERRMACRDRQIAAQAALLRSVTGKLEDTHDFLAPGASPAEVATARHLVAQILEVLS